jgi:putative tricarboxylic transport membrane protein
MPFVEQQDFVWGLIASMYLGNVVGLAVVLAAVPWFAAILREPCSIIAANILMLIFGVTGHVMKKLDYPPAPLVLPRRWVAGRSRTSASPCC